MWNSIYDEHGNLRTVQENRTKMKVPESAEDIEWMMKEIKNLGIPA